ncbi:MAG: 3'-5' exonuclease, partial [bacterium]|nr:3'-5' exonuclease [bacterium]
AALKLLQYEPIRNRLANRYRFIMIDEFQDTNELQWSLLSALARTTEGKLYSDRIFIVGDEKQSIYGFRGADVTVFENVRKEFAGTAWQMASSTQDETERPEIIRELSINFRTLPNPLDFVNALFRTIFPPDRKKCPQRDVPFQRLQCHRRMTEQAAGSVEILLPVKNKEGWAVKEQARLIARRIKVAVESPGDGPWALTVSEKGEPRPARYDDVAVLLRRRSFLPDLEEALRHEAVPFTVYAGIGYYQRQEIMDVLNALRFIADPTDDTALVGILRSPLFLLSDPTLYELAGVAKEAGGYWPGLKIFADGSTTKRYKSRRALNMIEHWIELANHISVSELIETIAGDSGFWTDLGLDTRGGYPVGNIEKLVRLADKWTRQKHVPLNEFVRHLDRLVKHQPREGEADPPKSNANAVQIMTIHAAKGLEFPLVFVPELDFRIQTSSSDRVYTLPGFGLGLKVEDPEQEFAEIDTAVRAMMKDSMRKNGLFEAKRLFYVALTRAKDHLILAAETQPAGKNKHWSEPPEKNEVRTWLDWLYPHLPDEEKLRDSLSPLYFTMHDGKNVIPVTIIGSLSQIPAPVPLSPSTDRPPEPSPEAYRFEHLRRVHKQTKRVVLAPTDLVKFEECPMKFVAVKGLGFDLGSLECIGAGDASQSHGDQESGSDGGKQKLDPLTRGNLAHGLLEYIDETYRNNTSLETLVEDVLSKGEIESYSHYPRRLKRAYLLKTGKEFMASRLYEELKKTTPGENKSEVPFTLAIGKALVHGRIDRLFSRGNRWQVLDYKTDSLDIDNLETSTSGRIFHHRPQMLLYSLAVQRGLKLPSESVAASLFFTTIMEEREVPLEQGEKCIISQTEDACRALEETWRSEANVYSDTDLIFERKPAAERLLFHLKDRLEGLFPQRFSLVPVERCGNCPLVHLCRRTI